METASDLAIRLLTDRYAINKNLFSYLKNTFPKYSNENWHHKLLCEYYEKLIFGEIQNLMVFAPPRHMKTEGFERAISFAFGHKPDINIINCAYSQTLANKSARKVRQNITSENHQLYFPTKFKNDSINRQDYWETKDEGHYLSAGVGGSITGRGFRIGFIDDPVKSREEAESATYQEKTFEWYEGTFLNRKDEENSAICIMHTRWNRRDLAGRILEKYGIATYNGHEPEGCPEWNGERGVYLVLCLPAQMTCDFLRWKHKDDPRKENDYLWESKYSPKFYEQFKKNKYNWNSIYQQQPVPKGGNLIDRNWIEIIEELPVQTEYETLIRFWDIAATKKENLNDPDYTCGALIMFHENKFYLLDLAIIRDTPKKNDNFIKMIALRDQELSSNIKQVWESQPGAAGKHLDEKLFDMLHFCKRDCLQVGKSKEFYVDMLSNRMETGHFKALKGNYLNRVLDGNTFFDEIEEFPSGRHDDRIDATAKAVFYLINKNRVNDISDLKVYESSYTNDNQFIF